MSDERNVWRWRKDPDPIKRAIAAVVGYSWVNFDAFEELQTLSGELRALIGVKARLATVEAERDALVRVADELAIWSVQDSHADADPDNMLDALYQAGYDEERCQLLWFRRYDPDALTHDARTKEAGSE